ncbi:hypothetical protein ACFC6L_21440 [Kitasatospora phosalacinea]
MCATGPDLAEWQRIGSAVVLTSDPAGRTAHLKALDAQDVHVVRI